MLLKEILQDESNVTVLIAPKCFFKTVNVDMVKRFLEAEVDDKGIEKVNKTDTKNYKLFSKLKIFINYRELFDEHFGKYPVVRIDYSCFNEIASYEDMLMKFRDVLLQNFEQHTYLTESDDLWITEGTRILAFEKYLDKEMYKNLSTNTVQQGFEFLCTLLHSYFQKKVFVLIDEYDAFINSLIFRRVKYSEEIVEFIQSVNSHLLKRSLDGTVRLLITGTLRLSHRLFLLNSTTIKDNVFFSNKKYAPYYGLTSNELEELLQKHTITNQRERDKLRILTSNYYGGYGITGQNLEILNPCSVFSYLNSNNLKSYWSVPKHKEFFTRLFYSDEIVNDIVHLLQNIKLHLEYASTLPVDAADVLLLKRAVELGTDAVHKYEHLREAFLKLILQLGYLKIITKTDLRENGVEISLPNYEIEDYFCSILLDLFLEKYDTKVSLPDSVNYVMNTISVSNSSEQIFIELHKKFCDIFCKSLYVVKSKSELKSDLFSIFRYKFRRTYTNVEENRTLERIDVVVRNENDVSFIININIRRTEDLRSCTKAAVEKMIHKEYINVLVPEFQRCAVYIGLCYSKEDRKLGLGYTKSINEGDNIKKITYILLSD